jgi:multidrug efflux pump subunit AcrA (membrane-fusion protein)
VIPDVQEKPDAGNAPIKSVQQVDYRALISFSGGHLESPERKLRLVPGMQVSAEIHVGTRTAPQLLLSSVQKIAHEAGQER